MLPALTHLGHFTCPRPSTGYQPYLHQAIVMTSDESSLTTLSNTLAASTPGKELTSSSSSSITCRTEGPKKRSSASFTSSAKSAFSDYLAKYQNAAKFTSGASSSGARASQDPGLRTSQDPGLRTSQDPELRTSQGPVLRAQKGSYDAGLREPLLPEALQGRKIRVRRSLRRRRRRPMCRSSLTATGSPLHLRRKSPLRLKQVLRTIRRRTATPRSTTTSRRTWSSKSTAKARSRPAAVRLPDRSRKTTYDCQGGALRTCLIYRGPLRCPSSAPSRTTPTRGEQ